MGSEMCIRDRSTICVGMAASMGAFLLSSGAKGKRLALPNAEIMIHQPSGGTQGQATDMQIQVERMLKIKQRLNEILAATPASRWRPSRSTPSATTS